ncbi:UNVERIFIED_CONTAM: hypothetical protein GTU68_004473 [Idotea baltica]|nr:hypothetical protein [Idotea baltica]
MTELMFLQQTMHHIR